MLWSSLLVLNLLHLLLKDSFLLSGLSVLIDSLSRVFLLELDHLLLMESVLLIKFYLINLGLDLLILFSEDVIVSLVLDFEFSQGKFILGFCVLEFNLILLILNDKLR